MVTNEFILMLNKLNTFFLYNLFPLDVMTEQKNVFCHFESGFLRKFSGSLVRINGIVPALGPRAGWPSAPAPPCCTRPDNGTYQKLFPTHGAGKWWMWFGSDGVSSWGFHRRTVCCQRPVSPDSSTLRLRCFRNRHLWRNENKCQRFFKTCHSW